MVSDRLTYHGFVSVADKQKCCLDPPALGAVTDVTLGIVEDNPFSPAQGHGKMAGIWFTQMNGVAVCEGGEDGGGGEEKRKGAKRRRRGERKRERRGEEEKMKSKRKKSREEGEKGGE